MEFAQLPHAERVRTGFKFAGSATAASVLLGVLAVVALHCYHVRRYRALARSQLASAHSAAHPREIELARETGQRARTQLLASRQRVSALEERNSALEAELITARDIIRLLESSAMGGGGRLAQQPFQPLPPLSEDQRELPYAESSRAQELRGGSDDDDEIHPVRRG